MKATDRQKSRRQPVNRTKVELKLRPNCTTCICRKAVNRTKVELK